MLYNNQHVYSRECNYCTICAINVETRDDMNSDKKENHRR